LTSLENPLELERLLPKSSAKRQYNLLTLSVSNARPINAFQANTAITTNAFPVMLNSFLMFIIFSKIVLLYGAYFIS
jgi:hypothetical protein